MELKLQLPITLDQLAAKIGAELGGNVGTAATRQITKVAALDIADASCISFLANPSYKKFLAHTKAGAVVLSASDAELCPVPALIAKNPRLALAKILQLCSAENATTSGIHPTAVLGNNVKLGNNVAIGPYCVIGDDCVIGDNTTLMPHVTVYARTQIGHNCAVHSGTVLGSDGFGYEMDEAGKWVKMPHLGGLVIGNHVEIGSNTSIDRGMLDNTTIGNGVIIDNLVQIGHNVTIGDYTAIAGCVGIAGSATIGRYCLIGGAACIGGHLTLADKVYITGTTAVNTSILEPGIYSSGLPARENSFWRRSVARFNNLDALAKRIRALEKVINTNE